MSIDKGYIDTPIPGVTKLEGKRGLVNFEKDFTILKNQNDEVILTNLTSPLDRPEKFRFAYSTIKDIYNNTDIHPNVQAPSKRGISILAQVTNTISVSSSAPSQCNDRIDLPVSAHMVLKFPANAEITAPLVEETIGRLLSGLYETGSVSTDRLQSMMRGSLLPKGL